MIVLLCQCYPGLRDRIAQSADNWIGSDGKFLYYVMLGELNRIVVENMDDGNYDHIDELFALVENVLDNGTQAARDLIATGFLEGMQNQTSLPHDLWAPLIGPLATEFCKGMDAVHGVDTPGLKKG